MAKSEPLIGYGLGMFPDVYPRYAIEDFPYHVNHAHSDWAEFAVEGGIPFLLVTEKGTDPSRISSVTTGNDGQTVQDYLCPPERTLNRISRAPLR